ncbi:Uncharacterized protein CXorf38-like [Stylophora pistillata]|uniref:Uncharacterized protein CXorf38-like n=2 Tax=Stylophora pistillata TaxID=50429 RepID=A0A2B4SD90_STYPI|nr:Uncharacterized protein CXorf38-like [Stylophora pistillata]
MASTSHSFVPAGPESELTIPKYSNWLAVGHALITVLCNGLRPYVKREMNSLYEHIQKTVEALPGAGPCQCENLARHDLGKCAWACELITYHRGPKPQWKQSDPRKWTDPNLGPWEIAKLYIPDLGPGSIINGADDMDITGILNLMYWCKQFTIPQPLVEDVREARNTKWAHVPKLELTDKDRQAVFNAIKKLLGDSQFDGDDAALTAREKILNYVSDAQTVEAQVLIQYTNETERDLSNIKNELKSLTTDLEHNEEFRRQLGESLGNVEMALENVDKRMQASHLEHDKRLRMLFESLHNMATALENVNRRMQEKITLRRLVQNGILFVEYCLIMCSWGLRLRARLLAPWLIILFLCNCFTSLDRRSFEDALVLPYETIGCFQDHGDRAIPTLEGQDSILDGSYNTRLEAINKCYQAAKKRGFQMFAVQNGGWCASSAFAIGTFTKYGKSSACKSDGEGGPWANQVYYIKGYQAVGCYKDTSDHPMETLEGKDSILDGAYSSRENPIAKCAVAALRKGYNLFAIQDGGLCAASAIVPQTFDKYGKSTTCKGDRKGGPRAKNVYVVNPLVLPYETIGCYQDHGDRAIPTLEGQDSILDGSYKVRLEAINKCYQAAKKRGFQVFAVQDGGWCATSASAAKTFTKYGKSSACKSDGKGGPWANQVYYIKAYVAVGCYMEKQDRAIETLEGKDSILKDSYNSRENPIAKCAVAAMRKGYSMFAVQDGGLCAAGVTAPQTFDKYGKSTYCEVDGTGGPGAINVYLMKEYEVVGCYKDKQDRAIETLEGKDSILDGAYNSRAKPIAKCALAAMRQGYSMFAVQNGGWCAATATALQTFNEYGKSTGCKADGEGGPWANNVYILRRTFL